MRAESTHMSTRMRAQSRTHMRSQERERHFVRAFPGESYMDMSKEPCSIEFYRKTGGPQSRDTRFVRACTVETHMEISQEISEEPFGVEI